MPRIQGSFFNPERTIRVDSSHQFTEAHPDAAITPLKNLDLKHLSHNIELLKTQSLKGNKLLDTLLYSVYGQEEGARISNELFICDPIDLTEEKEAKQIVQALEAIKHDSITADTLPLFQTAGEYLLYFATHKQSLELLMERNGISGEAPQLGYKSVTKLATYIKAALDQLKK